VVVRKLRKGRECCVSGGGSGDSPETCLVERGSPRILHGGVRGLAGWVGLDPKIQPSHFFRCGFSSW
jgi:hypothetical protein